MTQEAKAKTWRRGSVKRTDGIPAKEIAALRKALGWSLQRWSTACHVSINTAWLWEQGTIIPSVRHERKMRDVARRNGMTA